jgi:hypothetical protein
MKRIWDWWLEDLHPAHLSRPRSTMQSWAREIFWERVKLLGNRSRAAYISVSLTVKFGNRTSSCVTNPILKNPPSMHPYTQPKVNEIGTCSFSYLGSRKNQKKLHKFTCKEATSAWEISLIQHTDWILHLFVHHHFLCCQILQIFGNFVLYISKSVKVNSFMFSKNLHQTMKRMFGHTSNGFQHVEFDFSHVTIQWHWSIHEEWAGRSTEKTKFLLLAKFPCRNDRSSHIVWINYYPQDFAELGNK